MKLHRCCTVLTVMAMCATSAFAQQPAKKETKPATTTPAAKQPAGQMPELPPGFTPEMMEACTMAATPGKEHAYLTEGVGTWKGQCQMWMPGSTEAMASECMTVIESTMDGRFVRCTTEGDMPGMGPFHGFGIYGYDNVGKDYQGTWIDNCGTGMAIGTGELSTDGKVMTWTMTYNCPIKQGPVTYRQVNRSTGKDTMKMEMYMPDPTTGKEMKMMEIAYTRVGGAPAAKTTSATPTRHN